MIYIEEIIPVIAVSVFAAAGRGMRSYFKHAKREKSKFDIKKFSMSIGAVVFFSLLIETLCRFAGMETGDATFIVGQLAASWGLTDITEDVVGIGAKK